MDKLTIDKDRIISALAMIGALILVLFINNSTLIWIVMGTLFLVSINEAIKLYELENKAHFYISASALWICALASSAPLICGIFVIMLYAGIYAYKKSFDIKNILVFIYPTLGFLCIYQIYAGFGRYALICLIVIVAIADTSAYIGGKLFGKTPLSPTSPNKTTQGAIIGVLCASLIGGILLPYTSNASFGFQTSFIIGFVVSLCSILGDLFESMLKREIDIKDSGSLIPGHGGILDRVDGLLFGGVALLMIFYIFEHFLYI